MAYKPKGMHAAANDLASEYQPKKPGAPRTILPRGRRQSVRLLDSWNMVKPPKAIALPGREDSSLTPQVSPHRHEPHYLTKIAERWKTLKR